RLPPVFANGSKYPPNLLKTVSRYPFCQFFLCSVTKVTVHPPSPPKFQNNSPSPLLLSIRPAFGLPSPPPATPSDDMGIKRTSTLSSTSLTSQPLPTAIWIAGKKQEISWFLPKISIACSGDSEHHLLRSRYDFSTSRAVLAASCVGYEKFMSFGG
ncbi:unnamed protein product, partial [Prunus brigantina]